MKTIEERAKDYRSSKENEYGVTDLIGLQDGYVKGATEQREIDIQRACMWMEKCLPNIEYITNASALRQNKKQFIESFKQSMKGE